jgi:hypothetical protein
VGRACLLVPHNLLWKLGVFSTVLHQLLMTCLMTFPGPFWEICVLHHGGSAVSVGLDRVSQRPAFSWSFFGLRVCLVAVTSGEVDSNGFATCSLLSWAGGCCLAIVVAVASGTSPSQGLEAHSLLQQTSEKLAVMGQAWRHIPPTPTVWTRR